jgi:hypothetical protein
MGAPHVSNSRASARDDYILVYSSIPADRSLRMGVQSGEWWIWRENQFATPLILKIGATSEPYRMRCGHTVVR